MASQPPSKGAGSYTKAGERTAVTDYRNAARRYAEVNMWGTHDQREQLVSRFAERAIAEWRRRKLAGEKNWPKREQELLMQTIMVEIENGIRPSNIASGPPRVGDSSSFGAQGNVPPSLPPASQGNPLVSGDDKTKISAMRTRGKNDSQVISKLKENIWDSEADKERLHKVYAEGKVKAFTRRLAKAGGQTVPRPSRKEEDETLADIIRAFGPRRLPADFRPFINGSRFIPGSEAEKAYLENQGLPAPPAGGGPSHATRVPHHMASETYPQGYNEEREESDTDYEDFHISNSSDVENKRKNRVDPTGRGHGATQERGPTMPIPQPTTGGRGTGRRVTHQRYREDSDYSDGHYSDGHNELYDSPDRLTRRRTQPVPATAENSPGPMGQSPLSRGAGSRSRANSNAGSPVAPVTRRHTHEVSSSPPAVAGIIRSQKSNSPSMFGLDLREPERISDEDFYKQYREMNPGSLDDLGYTGKGKSPMVPDNLAAGQTRSRSSSGSNQSPIEIPAIGGGSPLRWDRNPFSSKSTQQPSGSMPKPQAKKSKNVTHAAGSPGQGFVGSPPSAAFGSPPPSSSAPRREVSRVISNLSLRQSESPAASTPAATTPPIRQGTPRVQQARATTTPGPTSAPRDTTPHRNPAPRTVAPVTGAGRGQGTGGAPHGSDSKDKGKKSTGRKK